MKSKVVLRCITAVVAICTAAMGLGGCNGNDENKVSVTDNLLASVQKSEDSPSYDFNDTAKKPEGYDSFVKKTGNMALQLLKQTDYAKSNTAISPVSTALSMAAIENAVSKDAQKEIKNHLGKSKQTAEEINSCAAYLTQRLEFFNSDNAGAFSVSSMWVSDKLSPKRSFLQKLENYYSVSAYKTDFTDSKSSTLIKNYISDNSNGLIDAKGVNIGSDYKLYIDSSAIVSDSWLRGYGESDVKQGSFSNQNGSTANVNFLTSAERAFSDEDAEGFVKDLKSIPCKLVCIMPNKDISLEKYLNELTADRLLNLPTTVSPTDFTNVSIPEFSVESSGSIKKNLENIGITTIFSGDADFSKGFAENLILNDVTQAVSISVNKNGISSDNQSEADKNAPKTEEGLVLDRPFIYAVVDNESYLPVIIGTVSNL